MNKKCIGCGATLQTINTEEIGYVKEQNLEKSSLCERCFRIINYNEYKEVIKQNSEFIQILKKIDSTKDYFYSFRFIVDQYGDLIGFILEPIDIKYWTE